MQPHGTSIATVEVLSQRPDEPVLCVVRGEIDISNADELADGLNEAFRRGPAVVADLSEVSFFASAGVRSLFQACIDHSPDRFLSVVTGPAVETILRICGVATVAPCRPDRESAGLACLAALQLPPRLSPARC